MAAHNETGKEGEELARFFLQQSGFEILETNWRFGHKEIDIIAQIGNVIHFVEVKARNTIYHQRAEELISNKKQQMLIEAADKYLSALDREVDFSFDLITIDGSGSTPNIDYIPNAFGPEF